MYSFQKAALIVCLVLGVAAKPVHPSRLSFVRPKGSNETVITLYQPTMYQIFPLEPDRHESPVSQLEVQKTDNTSTLENVAVFSGIPAGAKTCQLGWIQAAKSERVGFTVTGSGLIATQQLPRLPEGDITLEGIAPITEEAVEQGWPLLHPDTTSWPAITTATTHIAGFINCTETIYLRMWVDGRNGDGYVFLGQDLKNGLTLEVR